MIGLAGAPRLAAPRGLGSRGSVTPKRLSIAIEELRERILHRLSGGRVDDSQLIWKEGEDELLLNLGSLRSVCKPGWLVVELELEAGDSGRERVQLVFFLGREGRGDGRTASTTIQTGSEAGLRIADRWGAALQRVVWDAVLDLVEGAVAWAEAELGAAPELLGFTCSEAGLSVDVFGEGEPPTRSKARPKIQARTPVRGG